MSCPIVPLMMIFRNSSRFWLMRSGLLPPPLRAISWERSSPSSPRAFPSRSPAPPRPIAAVAMDVQLPCKQSCCCRRDSGIARTLSVQHHLCEIDGFRVISHRIQALEKQELPPAICH